jgi:hypothetical protein
MPLPKIETPIYSLKLPSDNKRTVSYRPFLVKEEKILLTAMEGAKELKGEEFQRIVRDVILRIIINCTDGKIDGNKLPAFDVDYLFLNIRAKSRGEMIEPTFTCNQEVNGVSCGNIDKYPIRIDEIKINFPEKDYSKIMIKDDIGIQLKFLSTEEVKVHDGETDNIEKMFKIIVDSIDYVFDAENVYKGKETSKAEMVTFVENLTEDAFDSIKEFFGNLPTLRHEVDYKCSKCGHKEPVLLEGLEDFFGFA